MRILLLTIFLSYSSFASLNQRQMQALPMIKATLGTKIEKDLSIVKEVFTKFTVESEKVSNSNYNDTDQCQSFFNTHNNLVEEANSLFRKVEINHSLNLEKNMFLKTRLEMIANFHYSLVSILNNESEGGIQLFTNKKDTCFESHEERQLTIDSFKKANKALRKAHSKWYGTRTLSNLNEDSLYYAEMISKEAKREIYKQSAIMIGTTLAFPLLSYVGSTAISAMSLTATQLKYVSIGTKVFNTTLMGYIGYSLTDEHATEDKIIIEEQEKLYHEINDFLETPARSPQIYYNFVRNIETGLKYIFNGFIEKYGDDYRLALDKCLDFEGQNCHAKWYKYL